MPRLATALRGLLSRARGNGAGYPDLVSRHRAMAKSAGCERHFAMAEAISLVDDRVDLECVAWSTLILFDADAVSVPFGQ